MIQPEKFFVNMFDDKNIRTDRLANFAGDCVRRLTVQNTDGVFTGVISNINKALTPLKQQLGQVDTGLSVQKGKTKTVQQVTAGFKKTMREKEGVIADALGGFETADYLEFYPHGKQEYTKASFTTLPVLLTRINKAVQAHSTQLPAVLATKLQGFETDWNKIYDDQQQTKGLVTEGRSDKLAARKPLEKELFALIHIVAQLYPDNLPQCMSLFNFSLLEGVTHHHKNNAPGTETPPSGIGKN